MKNLLFILALIFAFVKNYLSVCKTFNIINNIKKINLLWLLAIMSCGYSQTGDLNIELVRTFNPWGDSESPNYDNVSPPQFFNGKSDQFFMHTTEFSHTVIDLGEHDSFPDNPLRDMTLNYQTAYWGQLSSHTLSSYESSRLYGKTFYVKGSREDGYNDYNDVIYKDVIALWEIFKDTEPILRNEFYPFDIGGDDLQFGYFEGFNRDGHLMFYHRGNIVFVSQSGQYVSSLLNDDYSLNMYPRSIFVLDDDKYLLKNCSRLILIEHGNTGTDQILFDQDYSSTPMGCYQVYGDADNYSFTFLSTDGIYSVSLLTGESYLEISYDDIGFIPEEIIRTFDGFMVIKDPTEVGIPSYYAFLSVEWVQSEEKHLLRVKGKGTSHIASWNIDDINGTHILTRSYLPPDYVEISYDIYQWSISDALGIDEPKKDDLITVYPNPTNGKIQISCSSPIDNVTVYNILGKKILQTTNNIIDVTQLQSGVYFLSVYTDGMKIVKKMVKNNK